MDSHQTTMMTEEQKDRWRKATQAMAETVAVDMSDLGTRPDQVARLQVDYARVGDKWVAIHTRLAVVPRGTPFQP